MLGPPGAGKGTQARKICEELKFSHVSTGDMLREAVRRQTDLGKKATAFMESGDLVPDEIVDAIVAERLGCKECSSGFVLDGYPRSIHQAQFLQSLFDKTDMRFLSIGVRVEDKTLIERLSSRWTCPKCGKMFNASMDPGKINGLCDACGTGLTKRKDDTAEVVAERLQVYHTITQPLIEHYQKLGKYFEVDGERPIKDIFNTIMSLIKGRMN